MNALHIKMIMEVCEKFGCEFIDIFTSRRGRNVTNAKKVIYWLLRKEGLSYWNIGKMLEKDHTCILVGIRTLPEEYKSYAQAIYNKYRKQESLEQTKLEEQALEEKLVKITDFLNKGLTIKDIAKELGSTYDEVAKIYSLYVLEKKIPDYSTGYQKIEYFYKKK